MPRKSKRQRSRSSLAVEPDSDDQPPELKVDVADAEVSWKQIKRAVAAVAVERGHLFGYPEFDEKVELVMAPNFPLQGLNGFKLEDKTPEQVAEEEELNRIAAAVDQRFTVLNNWSTAKGEVLVVRDVITGKSQHHFIPCNNETELVSRYVHTIGTSMHHELEAEQRALGKLEELIGAHRLRHYFMTGMFFETSKRSNIVYFFRRCRPTIACSMSSGYLKPLCTLCMHPLGHYEGTYQGVMVPTDDVIAHLVLMRGDEHMYWRKANQHPLTQRTASAL